ncbi:glycosyltransferase [Dyadobacter sp. CY347]|uniref:glycosyltransferase n=1 Tax=Dyadobacter sp. CY347 TaxID=2909336 RepID=UPI001F201A1B|nr:glycosyltransferase [Dyadobacter sp. CY347]MCF2487523.1 glycosyltransferase [Dyadobacter sp. CY347]
MTKLSVIISSYNQSKSIIRIIDLLLQEAAESQMTLDLIIADDGSTQDELQHLYTYIQANDVPARIVWQRDKGFRLAASRNNGLKLAIAEIIIFMDGDCLPNSDFLKQHLFKQQKLLAPSICIGKRKFNDAADATHDQLSASIVRECNEDFDIRSRLKSAFPWEAALGRNFSLKRGEEKIYFDEDLWGWGMEDLDFAIKYYRAGCRRFMYIPEAVVNQSDDLSKSYNPFANPEAKYLLPAIGNVLLVMHNHIEEDAIFIRLAFYLQQYLIPFKLEESVVRYFPEMAAFFYQQHESLLPKEKTTVLDLYRQALKLLVDQARELPEYPRHPILKRAIISDPSYL